MFPEQNNLNKLRPTRFCGLPSPLVDVKKYVLFGLHRLGLHAISTVLDSYLNQ